MSGVTDPATAVVVVRASAELPGVCFKCGTTDGVRAAPRKFRTSPKDLAALGAAQGLGLVVGWIGPVADLVELARVAHGTREATVAIPLCPVCASRWTRAERIAAAAGFGPFLIVMMMIVVVSVVGRPLYTGYAKYLVIASSPRSSTSRRRRSRRASTSASSSRRRVVRRPSRTAPWR